MAPDDNSYVNHLAANLRDRGCDVVSVHLYWQKSVVVDLARIFWLAVFKRYRILHIHWIYLFPTLRRMKLEYAFFRLVGLKLVWTIHNILPHRKGIQDRERARWFFQRVDRKIIHYRSNIKDLVEKLDVEPAEDLHVIPHASFTIFQNRMSRHDAREKLRIEAGVRVILCFGQIRPNRGYEYFLDALKLLGANYVGIIVGEPADSELSDRIRAKAEELPNLMLDLRFIDDDEIQVYLNACDVVTLPYTEITTSGVAMLAFAFSRPVVATSIGCLPEVVEDNMGILIKPHDTSALVSAVKEIFEQDPDEMGRYAHDVAESKYSWESVLDRTLNVYAGL